MSLGFRERVVTAHSPVVSWSRVKDFRPLVSRIHPCSISWQIIANRKQLDFSWCWLLVIQAWTWRIPWNEGSWGWGGVGNFFKIVIPSSKSLSRRIETCNMQMQLSVSNNRAMLIQRCLLGKHTLGRKQIESLYSELTISKIPYTCTLKSL